MSIMNMMMTLISASHFAGEPWYLSTSVCDTVCAICTPVIRIVDVFISVSVSSHDDYRALVSCIKGVSLCLWFTRATRIAVVFICTNNVYKTIVGVSVSASYVQNNSVVIVNSLLCVQVCRAYQLCGSLCSSMFYVAFNVCSNPAMCCS